MKTTAEIRQAFLDFFVEREHRLVASADLVPQDDPTLLFTTAGMVPFKPYYDGTVKVPFRRATSVQKCLRVKGKASDLENVGRTVRHCTFFEMLGNFSFGDYFKREAIAWAWEFATDPKWMGLPGERIWVSIFEDDDEAGDLWKSEVGLPAARIVKMGRKDNFWGPAGETGACGPCSEMLFDRGEEFGPADPATNEDRFLEFWNLVFPQYDFIESNPTRPLKNRGIDTGMGLERLAMLVQGKASIFETDGLWPACEHLSRLVDRPYGEDSEVTAAINACVDHARCLTFAISEGIIPSNEGRGYVMRAIIRRAIRLCKTRLHFPQPVLFHLVDDFIDAMGDVYPQIKVGVENTRDVIRHEEERFLRTVDQGQRELTEILELKKKEILQFERLAEKAESVFASDPPAHIGAARYIIHGKLLEYVEDTLETTTVEYDNSSADILELISASLSYFRSLKPYRDYQVPGDIEVIRELALKLRDAAVPLSYVPGERLFYLYDTLGFPFELSKELIEEEGFRPDMPGYEALRKAARAKARAAWKGAELAESEKVYNEVAEERGETEFVGYESLNDQADVLAIAVIRRSSVGASGRSPGGDQPVAPTLEEQLREGDEGEVVLSSTPFYAEAGGQIGDTGRLTHGDAVFEVRDTRRTTHGLWRHIGVMTKGALAVGQVVKAEVDGARRTAIRRHHSVTHLLNAALRRHLGAHVKQAGSLVAPDHLRFDFTHPGAIDDETLAAIEASTVDQIMGDHPVETRVLPIEEARKTGAVAVFGEKYGDVVRVLTMGPESTEFCGGTHLDRTGQIGAFAITGESSIAAGTRRIEALAGEPAVKWLQAMRARESRVSRVLSIKPEALEERVAAMHDEIKTLRKQLAEARQEASAAAIQSAGEEAVEVAGVRVVARRIDAANAGDLRNAADVARAGQTMTAIVLGAEIKGKASLIAAVTEDLQDQIPAGKLINEVAVLVGGKGGGRADLAQAGGKDAAQLDEAIAKVPGIVESLMG